MFDLLVRNVCLQHQQMSFDVAVMKGLIVKMESNITGVAKQEIDGQGDLILPPFVETHTHLDTSLTAGDPEWNVSGTLQEGIRIWQRRKQMLTKEDVIHRAKQVLQQYISHGVLYVRTHVDISDPALTALRALIQLREQVASDVTLQVIAFPQDGVWNCPDNRERLKEAIHLGVDGIGAIPHQEDSREEGIASLEYIFDLAVRHQRMVHVLCDEADSADSRYLEVMARLAEQTGLRSRVTASHVIATSYYSDDYFAYVAELVQRSGMNIVVCPLVNSFMQGRLDPYPKGRGIARVKELNQRGVNVTIAHDDIASPFYPLGSANMLQAAFMGIHLAHLTSMEEMEDALKTITVNGAKVLQLGQYYGIGVGQPAHFVLLPYHQITDLLRYQPQPTYVVSHGRVIAETNRPHTKIYI
jgi:cytosine deaminase